MFDVNRVAHLRQRRSRLSGAAQGECLTGEQYLLPFKEFLNGRVGFDLIELGSERLGQLGISKAPPNNAPVRVVSAQSRLFDMDRLPFSRNDQWPTEQFAQSGRCSQDDDEIDGGGPGRCCPAVIRNDRCRRSVGRRIRSQERCAEQY